MTTYWHWQHMTAAQRDAARLHFVGIGVEGMPPSGPESVLWALVETKVGPNHVRIEWQWRGGIWPHDLLSEIEIGRPAKRPASPTSERLVAAVPALPTTALAATAKKKRRKARP